MIEQLVLPGMNEDWGGSRKGSGRKAVMVERGGNLRRKHTSSVAYLGRRPPMRAAGGSASGTRCW